MYIWVFFSLSNNLNNVLLNKLNLKFNFLITRFEITLKSLFLSTYPCISNFNTRFHLEQCNQREIQQVDRKLLGKSSKYLAAVA